MKSPQPEGVVEASSLPFERIDVYDRRHFPAPRSGFLRSWIQRPGGHALAVVEDDAIRGYGVMRPCRTGYKIGPLFAANARVAEQLLAASVRESRASRFSSMFRRSTATRWRWSRAII